MAQSLKQGAAAQRVARSLRDDILHGALPPGSWLREQQLAERFHVGRYTLRSAFAELEAHGLLRRERHRGAVVRDVTRERIDEVYGFRLVVELGAFRMGLERGADLTAAAHAVREMEGLDPDCSWDDVAEVHSRFHEAVVASSGNRRLLAAWRTCCEELSFLISQVGLVVTVQHLAEVHRAILDALPRGVDAAVAALGRDIDVHGRSALHAAFAPEGR